jgi:uncharacterized protein
MNRWVVVLHDHQDSQSRAIRKERFAEHFKFLEDHFDRIVFSCGLREDAGEAAPFVGGFWIVEADSKAGVEALIDNDPYFRLGLREAIDIYRAFEGYI